jgi:hypothetical protein
MNDNKEAKIRIEEFRERLDRENLERLWKLEARDYIFSEFQDQPEKLHQEWIGPLVAAGLSPGSAFALVVEAHFHPN